MLLEVPIPACDNVTKILGFYNLGPGSRSWDNRFWDRPYMAQRELSELTRGGVKCPPPCHTMDFQTKVVYLPKSRYGLVDIHYQNHCHYSSTQQYEYGDPDWRFAIKLIFKDLVQEKK